MKKIIFIGLLFTMFFCKNESNNQLLAEKIILENEYASFGAKISPKNAISAKEMLKKYKSLKKDESIEAKFKTKIIDVCQNKGCWMNLVLDAKSKSFVKFEDYAFFVPMNAADKEVIVEGKAFVSETSVAELKHFAEDAGKSEAEIAKITKPEKAYKFIAKGVLIKK